MAIRSLPPPLPNPDLEAILSRSPRSPRFRPGTPTRSRPATPLGSPLGSPRLGPWKPKRPSPPILVAPPIEWLRGQTDYGVWVPYPGQTRMYYVHCLPELMRPALKQVGELCAELENLVFNVETPERTPNITGYVTAQKLKPLLQLSNLETLRVQASHLELTAHFLDELARALPQAKEIVLMHTGPLEDRRPVPFSALVPFARHCPLLDVVGTEVKMADELEFVHPLDPRYPEVKDAHSPVRTVWVGRDHFTKGERIIRGIRRVFPNLQVVGHGWNRELGGEEAIMSIAFENEIDRRLDPGNIGSPHKPLPELPPEAGLQRSDSRSHRF